MQRKPTLCERWRVACRFVLFAAWTSAMVAVRLAVLPTRLFAPRFELRARGWIRKAWGRGILAIARVALTIEGTPPRAPFLCVSNHLSNLDVVLVSAAAGCTFVSRADVRDWPFAGIVARANNTVFVDRARRRDTVQANRGIEAVIREGDAIHLFAESRISQDCQLHPFKPALLQAAVQAGIPVYYAALSYSTPADCPPVDEVVVWKTGTPFTSNVLGLFRLPRLYAVISFGDAPIVGDDRKALADQLYAAVKARFRPVDTFRA